MKNIVKKVMPMNNGIFSHIDYNFLDFQSSDLDMLFLTRCGMRTVGPPVWMMQEEPGDALTQDQLAQLGDLILKMYKAKWDKISRLIDLEYDPIHNFSDVTTEEIVDNIDETREGTSKISDVSNTSETLGKKTNSKTEDDFTKLNTGTRTTLFNTENDIIGTETISSVRTDDLSESINSNLNEKTIRTDDLFQKVSGSETINVERSDDLKTDTTHSATDSNNQIGANNVFGFNSVVAVGDKTDTRESSGKNDSTDSVAETGTQTTVTTSSDSENTTNTGTVENVTSNSGSSTKENTGTQSKVDTVSKSSQDKHTGTDTVTDDLAEANSGSRIVNESVDSTNVVEGDSKKTSEESAEKHNNYTRLRTLTRNGNIGNITTQKLVSDEIELWRWNFIEEILNDVKDFLTIPVYE